MGCVQAAGGEAGAQQEDTTSNPAFDGGAAGAGARDNGEAAGRSRAEAEEDWCEGGELVAMADLKFSRVIGEVRSICLAIRPACGKGVRCS
jgi:hypothetical protein